MKFRRGMVGTLAMLCPSCMAPISVEIVTVEEHEPTDPDPPPVPAAVSEPTPEPTATLEPTLEPTATLEPTPAPAPEPAPRETEKRTEAKKKPPKKRKRKGGAQQTPKPDTAAEEHPPKEEAVPKPPTLGPQSPQVTEPVKVVDETPVPTEERVPPPNPSPDVIAESIPDKQVLPKKSVLPEPRTGRYPKGQSFRANGLEQSPAAKQIGSEKPPLPARGQAFFAQQLNGAAPPGDRLAPNTSRAGPEFGAGPKKKVLPEVRKISGPIPTVAEPSTEQPPTRGENTAAAESSQELKPVSTEDWENLKVRRKETRRQPRLLDWDTPDASNMPRAEVRADSWLEPGPDLLPESLLHAGTGDATSTPTPPSEETTPENHELKRKKKTERRKIVSGLDSFWNFRRKIPDLFGPTFRWALLALVIPVLGAGAWLVLKTFNHGAASSTTQLEEVAQKARERDLTLFREELSAAETAGAVAVVRKFLSADGVEAKLAFVRKPERVRPMMQKWYTTHPSTPTPAEHVEQLARKKRVGKVYFVFVGMLVGPKGAQKEQYYAVEQLYADDPATPNSFLVDWESSGGYQSVNLNEYRAKQPKSLVEFRVLMKPEAYYNFEFEDQKQWSCYQLTCPGDPDFNLYGYVKKGSLLEQEVLSQLFVEPNVVLSVRYPADALSKDQVIIEKIVHPTWFPEDAPAEAAGKP